MTEQGEQGTVMLVFMGKFRLMFQSFSSDQKIDLIKGTMVFLLPGSMQTPISKSPSGCTNRLHLEHDDVYHFTANLGLSQSNAPTCRAFQTIKTSLILLR